MTALGQVDYSQHGVCSYVYRARRRGRPGDAPLALKVMLNTTNQQQSVAIASEFAAEQVRRGMPGIELEPILSGCVSC